MSTRSVWDSLERALETDWDHEEEVGEVPELLDDALALMEHGRRLQREGLKLPIATAGTATEDEEYRAAARHGTQVPSDVLARMHREREEIEGRAYES